METNSVFVLFASLKALLSFLQCPGLFHDEKINLLQTPESLPTPPLTQFKILTNINSVEANGLFHINNSIFLNRISITIEHLKEQYFGQYFLLFGYL